MAVGAVLNPKPDASPQPVPFPTAAPSARPEVTPSPEVTPGPISTSEPGVTPGPIVTPAPTASPVAGGGSTGSTQTIEVKSISVTVPSEWTVSSTTNTSIEVHRPQGGGFFLNSGKLEAAATADSILEGIAKLFADEPDYRVCLEAKDATVLNGPAGRVEGFCYTGKTSSGKAVKYYEVFFVAVDEASVIYEIDLWAPDDGYQDAFADLIKNGLGSVNWKFYQGQ